MVAVMVVILWQRVQVVAQGGILAQGVLEILMPEPRLMEQEAAGAAGLYFIFVVRQIQWLFLMVDQVVVELAF
jgi:hypothetical protein